MIFDDYLNEHLRVVSEFKAEFSFKINQAIDLIDLAFRNSNKVLICGNGGSAADSQHFAAEFLNTINKNSTRRGLPAIALTTNSSAITARANDQSFEDIFSRQIDALGINGDILIVITTSGTSKNIIEAIKQAKSKDMKVIALTGINGIEGLNVDMDLRVPSNNTQHIQEAHVMIYHYICLAVEKLYIEN
jgi:D-sedoheptulose 7-phosphate isomerase